jgi:putative ABC transport system ATP-binding protein
MQVITISGLCKTYNANAVPVHALQSVNLGIDKGEFTAIVGPSGSGKTTLLNMLGGLDSPTSGEIFSGGKEYHSHAGNEDDRVSLAPYRLRLSGL